MKYWKEKLLMNNKKSIVGKSEAHEGQLVKIDETEQIGLAIVKMSRTQANHEMRITELEDTMRVNGVQERHLTKAVNKAVISLLEGKNSNAYCDRSLRGRTYSEINGEIKDKFGIPRRSELPRKDYQAAMNLIENWIPSNDLRLDINYSNCQLALA